MKKEKIVMSITIGISAFVLVAIMFMQFKVVRQTDITSIETMTESELRSELISWREKYEELELKREEVSTKINEYKEEYKSDEETKVLLEKELSSLQMLLGETEVQGQGIIITINEGENAEQKINYEDLLHIINGLKGAGAEAISINSHRIINRTDIVYTNVLRINGKRIWGPFVIKVNGTKTGAPFEITAIGYPEQLAGIGRPGGTIEYLESRGVIVTLNKQNSVTIPKYSGTIKFNYANSTVNN